ncbi:hypothetical protein D3C80_1558640 [compost metagenome]
MPTVVFARYLAGRHRLAQQRCQLEGTRLATFEQRRVQHRNAAEGQRAWRVIAVNDLLAHQAEVTAAVMARVVDQHQVSQALQGSLQTREVVVGPHIAIHQQERRLTQQRQGLEDAAAGFQRFTFR